MQAVATLSSWAGLVRLSHSHFERLAEAAVDTAEIVVVYVDCVQVSWPPALLFFVPFSLQVSFVPLLFALVQKAHQVEELEITFSNSKRGILAYTCRTYCGKLISYSLG